MGPTPLRTLCPGRGYWTHPTSDRSEVCVQGVVNGTNPTSDPVSRACLLGPTPRRTTVQSVSGAWLMGPTPLRTLCPVRGYWTHPTSDHCEVSVQGVVNGTNPTSDPVSMAWLLGPTPRRTTVQSVSGAWLMGPTPLRTLCPVRGYWTHPTSDHSAVYVQGVVNGTTQTSDPVSRAWLLGPTPFTTRFRPFPRTQQMNRDTLTVSVPRLGKVTQVLLPSSGNPKATILQANFQLCGKKA
ncbi:hypothetical protein NDU88_003727 [Pleurodeles waltl]|uniref:Uncharacterized protein n=1 Tax=Pleurodeles waltl TaxID=8319 RepID=A0AAV7MRE8_PLEWA|nr:hypothetical protein NDU88_003727 [Pleurodeles waltl]